MPKSKKQKTHHSYQPYSARQPTQQNGNDTLSHEEIWDDSALLRSWDDAVKEYEFYHSIHARGENVDEVLRKAELAELAEQENARQHRSDQETRYAQQQQGKSSVTIPAVITGPTRVNGEAEDSEEEGEIDEEQDGNELSIVYAQIPTIPNSTPKPIPRPSSPPPTTTAPLSNHPPNPTTTPLNTPPNPQINIDNKEALSTEQNQTLENMKMAYYWAGYYSGVHDSRMGREGDRVVGEGGVR